MKSYTTLLEERVAALDAENVALHEILQSYATGMEDLANQVKVMVERICVAVDTRREGAIR